jgi:hypothetical protein
MSRPRTRRYTLAPALRRALEHTFGERVDHVEIVEHSRWAKLHRGCAATTRPNRILLAIGGDEFVRRPDLVLHEYFHVLRQWQPRRLTRTRYVLESVRRGYWKNRYEVEAREFVAAELARFRRLVRADHEDDDSPQLGPPREEWPRLARGCVARSCALAGAALASR